jgi:uncharacterized repeat protein (TIGR01451 family)
MIYRHCCSLLRGGMTTILALLAMITWLGVSRGALAQSGTGAFVSVSKQVWAGNLRAGGTVTYILLIANTGTGDQADNPGNEFTDVLPSLQLTLVSATASAGSIVADVSSNTVTWNGPVPAGTSVALMINATIKPGTAGQTVTNQGMYAFDADGDGTNESTGLTVAFGGGPTVFVVQPSLPLISATKHIVGGDLAAGGTVIYAITLINSGLGVQPDNPGDEFSDLLPAGLTVGAPSADSGTVSASGVNPVTWNGTIQPNSSVTITIPALIATNASGTIANQGTINFDADANGSNESTILTDDPSQPGTADATTFEVVVAAPAAPPATPLPAMSYLMLALLAALLMASAALRMPRAKRR